MKNSFLKTLKFYIQTLLQFDFLLLFFYIFAAEKNIELELIHCDLAKGEHKTPEFIVKSPSGKIPVLELDDGRCISESVAICRYLEEVHPEPNLFGSNPYELAYIESRNRHLELELTQALCFFQLQRS